MLSQKQLKLLVERLNTNRKKEKRNIEVMVLKAKDLDNLRASDIIKLVFNLKRQKTNFTIS